MGHWVCVSVGGWVGLSVYGSVCVSVRPCVGMSLCTMHMCMQVRVRVCVRVLIPW
jgi:hypothetical protein